MNKNIELFCVIGYPVKHSLSPKIHNAAFRRAALLSRSDGRGRKIAGKRAMAWRHYEAVEVRPGNGVGGLRSFMKKYRDVYAGGNVTIPHKETVMKYLDEVSPEARAIGAVNTIVNRGGKLIGYNTDCFGALAALKEKVRRLRGKRAVVLGAGGAARAVVYGLKKSGVDVTIFNRTVVRAHKLAREFDCEVFSGEFAQEVIAGVDLIINTTSVGMWPKIKETPLPQLSKTLRHQLKKPIVMDIVYRPRITKFLRDAKKAGCTVILGEKMFLKQAEKSRSLWVIN